MYKKLNIIAWSIVVVMIVIIISTNSNLIGKTVSDSNEDSNKDSNEDSNENFKGHPIDKITLATNLFPNSMLIFIAKEKGYFEEQNLKIDYKMFPTGKHSLDAMIGGGADIATTADVPIALAGLADQPIKTVATIEYSKDNIAVVGLRDKISTPEDLSGKIIATTPGGGPLYFTHKYLENYNMTIEDVNLMLMKPQDIAYAFQSRDIDAFIVFDPYIEFAKKGFNDTELIEFRPSDLYGESWNIVVMEEYHDENPEVIEKFLRALVKAEEFLIKNPEESYNITSKYTEIELDVLGKMAENQVYEVVLNEVLTDSLYDVAKWAIEQEITSSEEIPDYNRYIARDYLLDIKPEGVKI